MTKTSARYSPEVRTRAVRMVLDTRSEVPSQWAALSSIAPKFGCTAETLRKWVRQSERDPGARPGPTGDERARIKALERENRELRQGEEGQETVRWTVSPTNEILRKGEPMERQWSERHWRTLFSPRRSSFGGAREPVALRRLTPTRK
jgi:transposase-like protein